VLQCVAVCCSVFQRGVARPGLHCLGVCGAYFLVRQRVAVCCSVLQCVAVCHSVSQCVAVSCSELQWVAVCCNVLQCVALCCIVLQIYRGLLTHIAKYIIGIFEECCSMLQCVAVCCSAVHWCMCLRLVDVCCV